MNFWKSVAGTATVTLTGADVGRTMDAFRVENIPVTDIMVVNELTVRFRCSRRDCGRIRLICRKRGDDLSFVWDRGLYFKGKAFLGRPILMIGVILLFILTVTLPTRVLFLEVQGNVNVPAQLILEKAGECGICFGASRRAVRSEKMKNALLEAMPELKWAGINTSGCRAVISVREREEQKQPVSAAAVNSIAAVRDGFITSCTATRGKLLCVPGQVVQEGQILISGFNDLGICLQVGAAEGEVFARTSRDIHVVTPLKHLVRDVLSEPVKRYSFIIGKKRINFLKDSGIQDATCGRMYEEYYITLPGGFCLPIRIGVETIIFGEISSAEIAMDAWEASVKNFAQKSIAHQMVAGNILSSKTNVTTDEGCLSFTGRYFCEEMIGRVITEEIGEANGKTD